MERAVGQSAVFLGATGRRSGMGRNTACRPLYGLRTDATTSQVANVDFTGLTNSSIRRGRRRRARESRSFPDGAFWSSARDTTVARATTANGTAGIGVTPAVRVDGNEGGSASEGSVGAPPGIWEDPPEPDHHPVLQANGEAGAAAQALPTEAVPVTRHREPKTDQVESQTDRGSEPQAKPRLKASKEGVIGDEESGLEHSAPAAAGDGDKGEPWYPRDALANACRTEPRLIDAVRGFVKANPGATIIYLSYAGSRLYGTSTATSDLDMKGIYIPGPPPPKAGSNKGAVSRTLQGSRASKEASSSAVRFTPAATAVPKVGTIPPAEARGQNSTSASVRRPPPPPLRPQAAAARGGDDDWAFPAAERYSYSSANTSKANTEDDIDLDLMSLDRFLLSLQRAEVASIETLFSMGNPAASLVSDPKIIPVIAREYPSLVCSNPTAWQGYISGHLAKFHKLSVQEAVARCALASAATAKRLKEARAREEGGSDMAGSGLVAATHGKLGGSSMGDGLADVAADDVGRSVQESMRYAQPGIVPLPSPASTDAVSVPALEDGVWLSSRGMSDATGVVGGGAGGDDSIKSLRISNFSASEVDIAVGEISTSVAPMSDKRGESDVLIGGDGLMGPGVTAHDAGDDDSQQQPVAVAVAGLLVEQDGPTGQPLDRVVGEDDQLEETETPEETIERVVKREGKVISHARRVMIEADELFGMGRLTLPLEDQHVQEIRNLKADRMLQRRVAASLKTEVRDLYKKAKESRLPSKVDRKRMIALRDDVLALHVSRGIPRRRKRQP